MADIMSHSQQTQPFVNDFRGDFTAEGNQYLGNTFSAGGDQFIGLNAPIWKIRAGL